MTNQNYSWQALMRYAHFVLNIKPNEFWDMTMLELLALSQEVSGSNNVITRKDLDYLLKKFS